MAQIATQWDVPVDKWPRPTGATGP
jgi:hypothetical protein